MKLLVDTQVFLWYSLDDPRLPTPMRSVLRAPDNDLWLSAASAWEITVKNRSGKLPLPMPVWDFILDARARLAFQALAIEERAVAHLPKLPNLHKDPFDRMLMCQSIEYGLTIATSDLRIRQYPIRTLWLENEGRG